MSHAIAVPRTIVAVLLAVPLAIAATPAPGGARVLFRFADSRITEASGLAVDCASHRYLTHGDSGNPPVLYAADSSGRTVATYRIRGARNVDWEDVALEDGVLYVGDIGDNLSTRRTVTLYRLRLPRGPGGTVDATRFRLRYPDGPHDAEALLVTPGSGRVYIATKTWSGRTNVYAAPARLRGAAVNDLTRIGSVPVFPVTAGDISADGRWLVLRTYVEAYEWRLDGPDVAAALRARPLRDPLPRERQGEAVTYDCGDSALLTTSEGAHAPVHEVPVTRVPLVGPPPPSTGRTSVRAVVGLVLLVAFSVGLAASVAVAVYAIRRRPAA